MRIIRYREHGFGTNGSGANDGTVEGAVRLAVVTDNDEAFALEERDFLALLAQAERSGETPAAYAARAIREGAKPLDGDWRQLRLLAPIDAPEVWAAGVTYQRSREARNYEATGGKLDATTFYDKVYDAERPELFMKSTAARTAGPGEEVCLRGDSEWQVPEPELGLVLDGQGRIVGYTAGNDMSCRDIEGENPLYLPQAKIWKRSCAIGPAIRLAETVADPYALRIGCRIYRGGELAVEEYASTGQLKRKLEELTSFLVRDNVVFAGTVLLTGTCIVPPNQFTLQPGDRIEIDVESIGTLINHAAQA